MSGDMLLLGTFSSYPLSTKVEGEHRRSQHPSVCPKSVSSHLKIRCKVLEDVYTNEKFYHKHFGRDLAKNVAMATIFLFDNVYSFQDLKAYSFS